MTITLWRNAFTFQLYLRPIYTLILSVTLSCGAHSIDSNFPEFDGNSTVDSTFVDFDSSSDTIANGDTSIHETASSQDSSSTIPACTSVSSFGAITFTRDYGKSTAEREPLKNITYTRSILVFHSTYLMAAKDAEILESKDAGCTWRSLGKLNPEPNSLVYLTRAGQDDAYAWGIHSNVINRIHNGRLTPIRVPVENIIGVGSNSKNAEHVRFIDDSGQLWESTNGALSWKKKGALPSNTERSIFYQVAFNPNDFNHIIVGHAGLGSFVTFDGAQTWLRSRGFTTSKQSANIFNLSFSSIDSNIIWASGLRTTKTQSNPDRFVFRSIDGGRSFSTVFSEVQNEPSLTLTNDQALLPDPSDKDAIITVFLDKFSTSNPGTHLVRYHISSKEWIHTFIPNTFVSSLAAGVQNPSTIYFGLEWEARTEPMRYQRNTMQ